MARQAHPSDLLACEGVRNDNGSRAIGSQLDRVGAHVCEAVAICNQLRQMMLGLVENCHCSSQRSPSHAPSVGLRGGAST